MQISVSGKHLDISQTLVNYVEENLNNTVKKYFDHAISANVVFTKERHLFCVDILVNEGTGNHVLIKSHAEEGDVYGSFDVALEKITKQLRRYKDKIKGHHKARLSKENIHNDAYNATKFVIPYDAEAETPITEENDAPLIIAEKPTQIEELTVSDAVMRMDLGELPALMFINKKSKELNVIYRRSDGNISWIDPSGFASAKKNAAA